MSSSILFFIVLSLFLTTVSAGIIRDRRAIEDYWYSNGVVNNMVSDNIYGGSTSLGKELGNINILL